MRMFLVLAALLAGCPPKPGLTVTCVKSWFCRSGCTVDADCGALGPCTDGRCNDESLAFGGPDDPQSVDTFCTDPDDPDHKAQIKQYADDFAANCGGVNVQCGNPPVPPFKCVGECTGGAACDITGAVAVRLR